MSNEQRHPTRARRWRSAAAVTAGLVSTIILSSAVDVVLEVTGVFPPVAVQLREGFTTGWMVLLALAYRSLFLVVGGYVTGRLAPHRPVRHAVILGLIGTVLTVAGSVAAADVVPVWYSVALVVLGLPLVVLGARLSAPRDTTGPTAVAPPTPRPVPPVAVVDAIGSRPAPCRQHPGRRPRRDRPPGAAAQRPQPSPTEAGPIGNHPRPERLTTGKDPHHDHQPRPRRGQHVDVVGRLRRGPARQRATAVRVVQQRHRQHDDARRPARVPHLTGERRHPARRGRADRSAGVRANPVRPHPRLGRPSPRRRADLRGHPPAPRDWPHPNVTFVTEGVAAAIALAKQAAGERTVAVASADVARQCLELGLLDAIRVDLVPVILGAGRPYFGGVAEPVRLCDPVITPGRGVTHLLYEVQR